MAHEQDLPAEPASLFEIVATGTAIILLQVALCTILLPLLALWAFVRQYEEMPVLDLVDLVVLSIPVAVLSITALAILPIIVRRTAPAVSRPQYRQFVGLVLWLPLTWASAVAAAFVGTSVGAHVFYLFPVALLATQVYRSWIERSKD